MDTEFAFDTRDALVTADIDLIMDDEPCDAMASDADADAVTMWQDDAARILFADAASYGAGSALVETAHGKQRQQHSADGEWRPTCLRPETRSRNDRSFRKYASSSSSAAVCRSAPPAVKFEPSHEPCTDEIPYSDLVFWLGDSATGEVECSCAMCVYARTCSYRSGASFGSRRYSPYERISSKIPVINLPRIEGVN